MSKKEIKKLVDENSYFYNLVMELHDIQQTLNRSNMKSLAKQVYEIRKDAMYLQQYYRIVYRRYEEYFSRW